MISFHSRELKSNEIDVVPNLKGCNNLRVIDLSWNKITSFGLNSSPFEDLAMLHDLLLSHNNLTKIDEKVFKGLSNLQNLDLSNNEIEDIHGDAFTDCTSMRDM